MKKRIRCSLALALAAFFVPCVPTYSQRPQRVVHVFVALADNKYQGIVPVPPLLGNGSDPARNLYWGAAYGVRTYFKASSEWQLMSSGPGPKSPVLERCVFKHHASGVYLVADAYEGRQIRTAVMDFLSAAAGSSTDRLPIGTMSEDRTLSIGGGANLVAYVGHDAFMDFQVPPVTAGMDRRPRSVIVLPCASKIYFARYLKAAGARPLLWTTNLMAPEAYTLKAALDGWIAGESDD